MLAAINLPTRKPEEPQIYTDKDMQAEIVIEF
jgi:hypothetical protein